MEIDLKKSVAGRKVFYAIGLFSLLTGCTLKVALRYQPTGTAYSLSVERKPKLFIDRVEDKTGGKKVSHMGAVGSMASMSALMQSSRGLLDSAKVVLDTPLTEFVKESLKTEFNRLGIPSVDNKTKSDAIVAADIITANVVPLLFSTNISIKITFLNSNGKRLWDGIVSGAAPPFKGFAGGGTAISKGLNDALADAMVKIGPLLESEDVISKIFAPPVSPTASASQSSLSSEEIAKIVKATLAGAAEAQNKTKQSSALAIQSDVDKPKYKSVEHADNFALVVGIEKYSSLPEAQFAERDAEAVREHLVALGYPLRNIVLLTDLQATNSGLVKNLEAWLPNNVNERSTVFFYYSGHGAPEASSGQAYLVPIDGDPQYLEKTGYPVKRLYERLNSLKAKRVIVALDSCFSGAGGRSVLAKGTKPLVTKVDTGIGISRKIIALSFNRKTLLVEKKGSLC